MLEKNDNFCYFDAHFHYFNCNNPEKLTFPARFTGASCAHSPQEWKFQQNDQLPEGVIVKQCFGLHPQSCVFPSLTIDENISLLENLCREHKLDAIGEAGFDFFTEEYKEKAMLQEKLWNISLELAINYQLPLVVHCRKANNKLFEYKDSLREVPAVLFHSFMGPEREAESLIEKGINCYFSFGKQILNGNKKVIDCVEKLPLERLLCETDAPYQFLKGEEVTNPSDLSFIYEGFFNLRKADTQEQRKIISQAFECNFNKIFCWRTEN